MKKADLADESDSARSAVWYCCKFLAGVLRILFFGSLILLIAIVLSRLGERPMEPWGGGGTYIRWGRTSCPETPGTELVYQGRAAGSFYNHKGGGANYLCVTTEPQSGKFLPGDSSKHVSLLYGSEYQIRLDGLPYSRQLHDQDVPCALCHMTTRGAVFMLPGRYECPSGWTQEYHGYLVTAHHDISHRTMFECMDIEPEKVDGGHANHDGALFYHVEPRCGSLPCPPYDSTKEMTCVVCSK